MVLYICMLCDMKRSYIFSKRKMKKEWVSSWHGGTTEARTEARTPAVDLSAFGSLERVFSHIHHATAHSICIKTKFDIYTCYCT